MEVLTDLIDALGPDAAPVMVFIALTFVIGAVLVVQRIFSSLEQEREVHAQTDGESLKRHMRAAVQEAVEPLQKRLDAIEARLDERRPESASNAQALPKGDASSDALRVLSNRETPLGDALGEAHTDDDYDAPIRNTSSSRMRN